MLGEGRQYVELTILNPVQVLMATNRIDILDPALLRPGRIDRKIEFPNPNESSRADILRIHSRKMNLVRGIDLRKIADKMTGASGAELKVSQMCPGTTAASSSPARSGILVSVFVKMLARITYLREIEMSDHSPGTTAASWSLAGGNAQ